MTTFDLHPEDLLERAERGVLGPAEQQRLTRHLAECTVCRVERALSAQARRDAAPLRDEQLLVARLKRDVAERLNSPPARAGRRRGRVLVVAFAAASLAGVAAAASFVMVRRAPAPEQLVLSAPPPVATRADQAHPKLHVTIPEPVAEAPSSPAATEALLPSTEPAPQPAALEPTSAQELFSRANQARREGKTQEALRLYRLLQERFAGSSEELVSRVALGRFLLDRLGDSRGALVQFNSYLASPGSGALREEAMVGRALSLGRMGRGAEERAAWTALLDAWPKSTHAKRAQQRLAELDAKPRPTKP